MNTTVEILRPSDHDLVIVTGFGDKGVTELARELNAVSPFQSTSIIPGIPWYRAYESSEMSSARISRSIDAIPGDSKILIGDSLGALMTLVYGVRNRLSGILKLILIDGPLRHDVDVEPHKKMHHLFFRQYKGREGLALEYPIEMKNLDLSRIITMGTEVDSIVPPEAKKLDGVQHITLPYRGHSLQPRIVADTIQTIL